MAPTPSKKNASVIANNGRYMLPLICLSSFNNKSTIRHRDVVVLSFSSLTTNLTIRLPTPLTSLSSSIMVSTGCND